MKIWTKTIINSTDLLTSACINVLKLSVCGSEHLCVCVSFNSSNICHIFLKCTLRVHFALNLQIYINTAADYIHVIIEMKFKKFVFFSCLFSCCRYSFIVLLRIFITLRIVFRSNGTHFNETKKGISFVFLACIDDAYVLILYTHIHI